MNYSESLSYLNSFINLERLSRFPQSRGLNLKRMKFLLSYFDSPEHSFFPVLIAGTKGKGSTGFFLESLLRENEITAGFYSSPHIQDVRERIRLEGQNISKKLWIKELSHINKKLGKKRTVKDAGEFTYFEIMTLLAALVFKRARLKVGIFEIGLGGRLDASNAIDAEMAVITPIHFDHENFLGNTITKIAREKAAIIRRGAEVIVSPQNREALAVINQTVDYKRAKAHHVKPLRGVSLGLLGDHQKQNASAALMAAKLISKRLSQPLSATAIKRGLVKTNWPGRLEQFKGKLPFVLDVAHNPASSNALARSLRQLYPGKNPLIIFGASNDKNTKQMLKALRRVSGQIILTEAQQPRAKAVDELLFESREYFNEIYPTKDSQEALKLAKLMAKDNQPTVATGSFYLVGEIRKELTDHHA